MAPTWSTSSFIADRTLRFGPMISSRSPRRRGQWVSRLSLSVWFAVSESAIYIDLGDETWRAVRIDAKGWQVTDRPPILFRRYDRELARVWMVTAPVANVPRPIITLHAGSHHHRGTIVRGRPAMESSAGASQFAHREPSLFPDPVNVAHILSHAWHKLLITRGDARARDLRLPLRPHHDRYC